MKYCQICGMGLEDNASFCAGCGAPQVWNEVDGSDPGCFWEDADSHTLR